jgi:hypothetical protein
MGQSGYSGKSRRTDYLGFVGQDPGKNGPYEAGAKQHAVFISS